MYNSDIHHKNASLQKKLQTLYTLNRNKKIDLSFRPPYLELLEKIGNPHLNLPPTIHIAGTNGKGSILAMLRSILRITGLNIHSYTSPHLIEFNERIEINNSPIDNATLEALIDEALTHNNGNNLTFFEITTAIALSAFAQTTANFTLLEVGMGGRLDCTNVIQNPHLTIINAISLDHTEHLGKTLPEIAAEKAGIMKPNTPCIIGKQSLEAKEAGVLKIFKDKAQTLNAPLTFIEKPAQNAALSLIGDHQQHNLAVALEALKHIQHPISNIQLQNALKTVHHPARLQKLNPKHYNLPDKIELYLDGGHNTDAATALATQAQTWQTSDPKPLHIIIAMMNGKNADTFIKTLTPYATQIHITQIENEPQSQTTKHLQSTAPSAIPHKTYRHALQHITQNTKSPTRILICGSLYLAGQVLSRP